MDRYTVKLYSRADRDLDNIYSYIAHNLLAPGTAVNEAIYNLNAGLYGRRVSMPTRVIASYSSKTMSSSIKC